MALVHLSWLTGWLAYFGVHVLRELQDGVYSGPGVGMLFQVGQHLLSHSLLEDWVRKKEKKI